MEVTITASQKLEFKIPTLPTNIATTTGLMPLESLSEDAITDIFDAMKANAIEYMKSRKDIKAPVLSSSIGKSQAGKRLADNIG